MMAAQVLPLCEVPPAGTPEHERLHGLCTAFAAAYGQEASILVRAPGRVNLIGEHIDYEGYGVLPLAIQQDCLVAACLLTHPGSQHTSQTQQAQPTQHQLHVRSSAPHLYPPLAYPTHPDQPPLDTCSHAWGHYVAAAWRGACEWMQAHGQGAACAVLQGGACVMVDGCIPPGAGLSSSSALVVAALSALMGLALGAAWDGAGTPQVTEVQEGGEVGRQVLLPTLQQVAHAACAAERHVGTLGGGMDQAACCMAQEGAALHVTFDPLHVQPVRLPPGCVLVVANSCSTSAKAETAALRFNFRVVECRLAAMVLAQAVGALSLSSSAGLADIHTLRQVQPALVRWHRTHAGQHQQLPAGCGPGAAVTTAAGSTCVVNAEATSVDEDEYTVSALEAAAACVGVLLQKTPYSHAQLESLLGLQLTQLLADSPAALRTLQATHTAAAAAIANTAAPLHVTGRAVASPRGSHAEWPGGFMLHDRALHVYCEAARVLRAKQVCESCADPSSCLSSLGALMDASHTSCSQLYGCSCEALDTLVALAKQAGAQGARLTGAGWGGSVVVLVAEGQQAGLMEALRQSYYAPLVAAGLLTADEAHAALFETRPSAGACMHACL